MTGSRELRKLGVFIRLAEEIKNLSTCKRRSVGAVLVPTDFSSVIAIGYNGQPAGFDNDGCLNSPGACGCIHAEQNLLAKNTNRRDDLILISTTCPCYSCALMITAVPNIKTVYYSDSYRDTKGYETLCRLGIKTILYKLTDSLNYRICKDVNESMPTLKLPRAIQK